MCVSVHVYVCVFTSFLVSHTLCSRRLCHHLHVCYSIPAAFCLFTHTMDSVTTALTWSQADSVTGEPGTTGNTHHVGRGRSLSVCVWAREQRRWKRKYIYTPQINFSFTIDSLSVRQKPQTAYFPSPLQTGSDYFKAIPQVKLEFV